jgi:drug/metabolite transporter (DMT)-like permease
MVLVAATLLGSMGAWGRLIFRYEPDPIAYSVDLLRLNLRGTLFGLMTGVSMALYTLGLRDLPASQASVIATWEVVTAAALGWLCYGELLAFPQIAGAALVCGGIAWIQRATA